MAYGPVGTFNINVLDLDIRYIIGDDLKMILEVNLSPLCVPSPSVDEHAASYTTAVGMDVQVEAERM